MKALSFVGIALIGAFTLLAPWTYEHCRAESGSGLPEYVTNLVVDQWTLKTNYTVWQWYPEQPNLKVCLYLCNDGLVRWQVKTNN